MFTNRLKFKGKEIFLLGSSHLGGAGNLMQIKKIFLDFAPEVVLVEGNFNIPDYSNEEMAIDNGIDMGLINYLSKSSNIPIFSNDPSFSEDIEFLRKISSEDKTFLYFFLRESGFRDCNELLEMIKKNSEWDGYDFSIDRIHKLYREYFNNDFELKINYSKYFDPTINSCFLNDLTRELNIHRDNFMINETKKLLDKFNRIFIIKGDFHIKSNLEKFKEILR